MSRWNVWPSCVCREDPESFPESAITSQVSLCLHFQNPEYVIPFINIMYKDRGYVLPWGPEGTKLLAWSNVWILLKGSCWRELHHSINKYINKALIFMILIMHIHLETVLEKYLTRLIGKGLSCVYTTHLISWWVLLPNAVSKLSLLKLFSPFYQIYYITFQFMAI